MKRFAIKRITSVLVVMLSVVMIITSMPTDTFAATNSKASVRFVYGDNDNPDNRTGIEAVTINDVVYYDINQGKSDGITPQNGNQIKFYKKALTSVTTDTDKNTTYDGQSNILNQWAELAEALFVKNSTYSMQNKKSDFVDQYDNTSDNNRTDISTALSDTDKSKKGTTQKDSTVISGLMYTDSLKKVRKESSRTVAEMIGRYSLDKKYDDSDYDGDYILDNNGGDNCHKALNDDTTQDVLYTMVTCVNKVGGTCKYEYQSFVLAFYDFELAPLEGDGLSYITAAEGYESLQEAVTQNVQGVSYNTTETDNEHVSYYKNTSRVDNTISTTFNESKSESVSNTNSWSDTYNVSQTIGYAVSIKESLSKIVEITNTISTSFTWGAAFSTAWSGTESISKSSSNTVSSSMTLPAHTAVEMKSYSGETDFELDYDCPVALEYKVAISSMSGVLYADSAAVCYIGTDDYDHQSFSTVFGIDSDNAEINAAVGGRTARENLYNRAVKNIDDEGFEVTYGQTSGWSRYNGTTEDSQLKEILGGATEDLGTSKVKPVVVYKEVDQYGVLTGRVIKSYEYGSALTCGEEYEIAPRDDVSQPINYVSTVEMINVGESAGTSEEEDDNDCLTGVECTAKIYNGKVWESKKTSGEVVTQEGLVDENTFKNANKCSKTITPTENGDNTVTFYYQYVGTEDNPEPVTPGQLRG